MRLLTALHNQEETWRKKNDLRWATSANTSAVAGRYHINCSVFLARIATTLSFGAHAWSVCSIPATPSPAPHKCQHTSVIRGKSRYSAALLQIAERLWRPVTSGWGGQSANQITTWVILLCCVHEQLWCNPVCTVRWPWRLPMPVLRMWLHK